MAKDFKTEMRIAINNSKPDEIINTAIKVALKHIEISNLVAIQDYLLEHGANDEKVNDKIRKINFPCLDYQAGETRCTTQCENCKN